MEVTEELIVKYFRLQCNAEEKAAVADFFDNHPDELEKYLNDEDWINFKPEGELDPRLSEEMFEIVKSHTGHQINPEPVKFTHWRVAATIALIAGIALLLGKVMINGAGGNKPQEIVNSAHIRMDTVYNTAQVSKTLLLEDSSKVVLAAHSEVIYAAVFKQQKRIVFLKGSARFFVKKDKTRPFTVFAGGLSTTALGTSFDVIAPEKSGETVVKLFTGKVVVRLLHPTKSAAGNAVFLTPGMMITMNKADQNVIVKRYDDSVGTNPAIFAGHGSTIYRKDGIYFKNQSLMEVVNVLEKTYQVRIIVNRDNLINKLFTGSVNPKLTTAYEALTTIARLNNLSLTRQNGLFKFAF
jgi:ferric-dicitrate binding protein FerR (iron transport regulator)